MNYTEIEMEWMKEILRDKEEEIKKLKEIRDNREEKIADLEIKLYNLEQENKKLKSDLSLVIKERDDNIEQNKKLKVIIKNNDLEQKADWKHIEELEQENKKLKEENSYRKKIVDITPQDEKSVAEETIQDLQERIRFLEQCLDNKEKVNKSLREELQRYKDMWDSWEF